MRERARWEEMHSIVVTLKMHKWVFKNLVYLRLYIVHLSFCQLPPMCISLTLYNCWERDECTSNDAVQILVCYIIFMAFLSYEISYDVQNDLAGIETYVCLFKCPWTCSSCLRIRNPYNSLYYCSPEHYCQQQGKKNSLEI